MRQVAILILSVTPLMAQQPDPIEVHRIPFYNDLCAVKLGHPDLTGECYRFYRPDPAVFELKSDPKGASAGMLTVRGYAAPGSNPGEVPLTFQFGSGFVTTQVQGSNTVQVEVDKGYIVHRLPDLAVPMPIIGASCNSYGSAVMWLGPGGSLCFCTPNEAHNGFVWACGSLVMREEPVAHKVTLNWTASTSVGVTGYNIYRGREAGGPYSKINTEAVVGTTYEDSLVESGKTYTYVATALAGANESGYSNEAVAVIP